MKKKLKLSQMKIDSFTTSKKENNLVKGGTGSKEGTGLCTGCPPIQCY